jgi:hypothetical protein
MQKEFDHFLMLQYSIIFHCCDIHPFFLCNTIQPFFIATVLNHFSLLQRTRQLSHCTKQPSSVTSERQHITRGTLARSILWLGLDDRSLMIKYRAYIYIYIFLNTAECRYLKVFFRLVICATYVVQLISQKRKPSWSKVLHPYQSQSIVHHPRRNTLHDIRLRKIEKTNVSSTRKYNIHFGDSCFWIQTHGCTALGPETACLCLEKSQKNCIRNLVHPGLKHSLLYFSWCPVFESKACQRCRNATLGNVVAQWLNLNMIGFEHS